VGIDIGDESGPHGAFDPIRVQLAIGTDTATLSRAAFGAVPAKRFYLPDIG
jgi:hypothetical protein